MRISDWSSDVCSSDLPYLRVRDGEGGAEFYRLGSPGVIVLEGVTFGDVAALHAKHPHDEDMECLWITSPDTVTADEKREWRARREPAYRVTSSVVRRLGLPTRLDDSSLDTWEGTWDAGAEGPVDAWVDRTSVVSGKGVSASVEHGGGR